MKNEKLVLGVILICSLFTVICSLSCENPMWPDKKNGNVNNNENDRITLNNIGVGNEQVKSDDHNSEKNEQIKTDALNLFENDYDRWLEILDELGLTEKPENPNDWTDEDWEDFYDALKRAEDEGKEIALKPRDNVPIKIASADVTITSPEKDGVPDTAATVPTGSNYTAGQVIWYPAHDPFQSSTQYTATVTIAANEGYLFTDLTTATINGNTAVTSNNTGTELTLSYQFSATSALSVTNIAIKTQPAKLSYAHGEALDLSGLVITVTYENASTEDVPFADFGDHISTQPVNETELSHFINNGQPVKVSRGSHTVNTANLIVSPPIYTVTFNSNSGSAVASISNVVHGSTINAPSAPTRTNFIFQGWYNEALTTKWNFTSDTVTGNITLYARWTNINGPFDVGDTGPGGGIIFYFDPNGFIVQGYTGATGSFSTYHAYYLEVAPSNSGSAVWGDYETAVSGVTDERDLRIGIGRSDTRRIIDHMNSKSIFGTAAHIAASSTFGGRNDWYLPSVREFLLYRESSVYDIPTSGYSWTSSQSFISGTTQAWCIIFNIGGSSAFTTVKNSNINVRAIRAF